MSGSPTRPRYRRATASDADAVARLHADSWRRHYRGAYSDAYLDGDVVADRRALWTARLRSPDRRSFTVLAEAGGLAGFAHALLQEDSRWGTLVENLHVAVEWQRRGVGRQLLALTAEAALAGSAGPCMYLWVLEQNADARRFYEACGAVCTGREPVSPPGGVSGRLAGSPAKLLYAWPDIAVLREPSRGVVVDAVGRPNA